MNTRFAQEKLLDVLNEAEPMLRMHYNEVALHKDVIKLDPDWSRYVAMEERGQFVLFTARCNGVLVGYAAFFITNHIHYSSTVVGSNDVVFIDPSYRKGTLAMRLIQYAEKELKARGVDKVTYHVKYSLDWSSLLYREGYENEEKIVGKIL